MNELAQISDSELTLMRLIWQRGGVALYADITDDLAQQELDWKKNTVLTFLSRLVEKKYLCISKIGRRNEYIALVSQEQYNAAQTRLFLNRVYDGKVKNLVSTLLGEDLVSEEEKERLRQFWKDGSGNE